MQSITPTPSKRVLAPSEVSPLGTIHLPLDGEARECSMCRTDRRICDGGRPCTRCVTYGFQCRDVRKRGRPKKDQEDKSLTFQEHPLFSEWSLGGGAKAQSEAPRKKRRQTTRSAGTSTSASALASGRHTSAASLRPGETLPVLKTKSDTTFRNSQTTATAPSPNSTNKALGKPSKAASSVASINSPIDLEAEESSYSASTTPYGNTSTTTTTTASYGVSSVRPSAPLNAPFYSNSDPTLHANLRSYTNPTTEYRSSVSGSEQTSESLEQQLQRYREQYRLLHPQRKQTDSPTSFYNTSSSYSNFPQPQQPDFPQPGKYKRIDKEGYEGGAGAAAGSGSESSPFPFLNCLQELLKVTQDKPSSVMMREEVICVDSLRDTNNKSNKQQQQHQQDDLIKRTPNEIGGSASFSSDNPSFSHYPPYPSSMYSHHQQLRQQPQQPQHGYNRHPYYPPSSSSFSSFNVEEEERQQQQQSRGGSSFLPFQEERRAAWDFSSPQQHGGSKASMDRQQQRPYPSYPPSASSSSASSTSSPSLPPPQSSSLLRLLAYES